MRVENHEEDSVGTNDRQNEGHTDPSGQASHVNMGHASVSSHTASQITPVPHQNNTEPTIGNHQTEGEDMTRSMLPDHSYDDLRQQLANEKNGILSPKELLDVYQIRVHNIRLFKSMFPEFKNYSSI